MEQINDKYNNTFEDIKHIDEYGNEYWFARELQVDKYVNIIKLYEQGKIDIEFKTKVIITKIM